MNAKTVVITGADTGIVEGETGGRDTHAAARVRAVSEELLASAGAR